MKRNAFAAVVLALALSGSARASGPTKEIRAVARAGGGLDAVEVVVAMDRAVLEARRCKAADCAGETAPFRRIPLGLDPTHLDAAKAVAEIVAIGDGRQVIHVRVPDAQRRDLAFEALLAGHADAPIFAGLTGYSQGEEGDRSGAIVLVYDRDAQSKFVLVAESREDTRICGQAATPLSARGLDPKSMQLRGATLHRLDKSARDSAVRVFAQAKPAPRPVGLGRLLTATGGSAAGAGALTDGALETTWSEKRPGDGHGEFVTMRAPSEAPIAALRVAITPAPPKPDGAAPRSFFVATDAALFHVTMPEDAWLKPGGSYTIDLPQPVKTTCLAIVLDEAYPRGLAAPDVTLAEVAALTKFDLDGATLDDVAGELAAGRQRRDEAAAILQRAGEDGVAAVTRRWATLDPTGRAAAIDVASSAGGCTGPGAELLTRGIADADEEVRRRARRLERCGKAAVPALVAAVASDDEPRRAASAPLLATISGSAAIGPLGDVLGRGSVKTREAVRSAFARAARTAGRDELASLLTRREAPLPARLDLLRALGPRLPELRPGSSQAIADILAASPDMPTRWLVAGPLAQLARAPAATEGELTRLAELVRRDPEPAVRARAVELGAGIAPLTPTILAAAADPEPRVREAALRGIAAAKLGPGAPAARRALAGDPWTFVRVAAALALGAAPADGANQAALAEALGDKSARVRSAVLVSLGALRAAAQSKKIRQRLDDAHEDIEVRALAAKTLGELCAEDATDTLTELAVLSRAPVDEADERLGVAAIDALAILHPRDLERRLAPLRAAGVRAPVRRAADRALADPGACR